MKARISLLLALVLVLGGLFAYAGGAGAAAAAPTKVTIKGPQGDFFGKILSTRKKCLGNRTVKVYKQKGREQKPSSDKLIASDTSERQGDKGVWSVGNTGYKQGKFYARATKKPGCKAGTSKTIKIVATD